MGVRFLVVRRAEFEKVRKTKLWRIKFRRNWPAKPFKWVWWSTGEGAEPLIPFVTPEEEGTELIIDEMKIGYKEEKSKDSKSSSKSHALHLRIRRSPCRPLFL